MKNSNDTARRRELVRARLVVAGADGVDTQEAELRRWIAGALKAVGVDQSAAQAGAAAVLDEIAMRATSTLDFIAAAEPAVGRLLSGRR